MSSLIPKEDIPRDRIAGWMKEAGLELHPTSSTEGLFWQIWMTADEATAVHYCDDSNVGVKYFSVRGKKERSFTKKLRQAFPIWERDELLKHALFTLMNGSEGEIAHAAMLVSVDMDEFDAASAGVLNTFLQMDERSTRLAGARALRLRPFFLFRGVAKDLAADPDPEIAGLGQGLLNRIIQLHGE